MKTRTICCKLVTTSIANVLKKTSKRFFDACNHVLKIAREEKMPPAIPLYKLCYADLRNTLGLSANLAVRAIRRVVACLTKRHTVGIIRFEQLKNIGTRTKTWNKHLKCMMAEWSFYQLQQFVQYKAASVGIALECINPAYTSQICHHCLKLGSRKGEHFNCLTCGPLHIDVNASHVIALGGVVYKPARIKSLCL